MRALLDDLRLRAKIEWGGRILLAAAVVAIGYGAVTHSRATSLPVGQIERAHGLAPNDARITAELALKQVLAEAGSAVGGVPDREARARIAAAETLARGALDSDPMAVAAVDALGMSSDLLGNTAAARRWFTYSDRLSRRDLTARLWLIEDAVAREDIVGALHHYDIALRTKAGARDLLYPVLTQASVDPAITPELVKVLSKKPLWKDSFLVVAAGGTPDPEATSRMFVSLRRSGVDISYYASAILVDSLLAAKKFDSAWRYFVTLQPKADRRRSRDPDFATIRDRPSQLDWVPTSGSTGLSASLASGGKSGLLDFSAPPGVAGELIRQLQLLPPGRYVLEGRSTGVDQPERSQPYWLLRCGTDGRELGRVVIPNSANNDGRFSGSLDVPQDCPAQLLALIARESSEIAGLSGQIERMELRPAG
ncbi:hypothetical protein PIB19_22465 [Sphingomonas sp. 7/4-4]|uniref:hypothetical protein n=1 Tax=Sphingomonas sp. 7/4-4 TaxID=3018446 RepID=UPI0022F3BC6A|nr:hypothetical protein [Sphingomonas sp. 7/4-4]WBY07969.1 hypothetical protein PIB19_22465 [Sphingomonas sp. 7/4-4]